MRKTGLIIQQYKQTEENGQIANTKNKALLKNQPKTGCYKDNNYILQIKHLYL
jgi:hypothetical protein